MHVPPSLPPPGWYPDPDRPGASRWWNGAQWAAPTATHGDPSDQMPDVGDLISSSFRRALRHWRALAMVSLITAGIGAVLIQMAFGVGVDGVVIDDGEVTGWSGDRLPLVLALAVAGALSTALAGLATAWLTLRAHDEEDAVRSTGSTLPDVTTASDVRLARQSMLAGVRALPRAIGWYLVGAVIVLAIAIVGVLLTVVAWPLGVLAFLGLIPVIVYALVKFAFFTQAIVDGRGNPYARSWTVSRGRFWPTLGRCLLLVVIAGAINSGISVTTSLLGGTAVGAPAGRIETEIEFDDDGDLQRLELDDLTPSVWGVVVGAIGAAASLLVTASITTAGFAQLYRSRQPRPR